jgi:hypothetical protein
MAKQGRTAATPWAGAMKVTHVGQQSRGHRQRLASGAVLADFSNQ